MPRKQKKRSRTEKHDFNYHLKHKSKLTLFFIIKIILAFASFFLAYAVFAYVSKLFGNIFAGLIAMAIMFSLYLFLVIKVLNLMRFN